MEWIHVEDGKPVQFKSVYFSIDEAVYKGMYVNHSFYDHDTGNYLEANYWMPVTNERAPFPDPPNSRS